MISVPCPRCTSEFKAGRRDEDRIGSVDYQKSGAELEPLSYECSEGHFPTTEEWVVADKDANEARMDAKYNR